MRVHVTIFNGNRVIAEGAAELSTIDAGTAARKASTSRSVKSKPSTNVDFSIPMRPFIKKFAKNLSGPRKFTLLLAHLAKGNTKTEVSFDQIESSWNRMKGKGLLGMEFNRFFAARARENDWAESKRKGIYSLRPAWKEMFA